MSDRILASATVDMLRFGPVPLWEVTVTGQPDGDHTRTYHIEARTDDKAAQEGLDKFVEEITILRDSAPVGMPG